MRIELFIGTPPDRKYRVIGPVKAKAQQVTIFGARPTEAEVHWRLQAVAAKLGANGVVEVAYSRGISAMSWDALTATGIAVFFEDAPTVSAQGGFCAGCGSAMVADASFCTKCGRARS